MFKRPLVIVLLGYILGIIWGIYVKNIFSFFIVHIIYMIVIIIIQSKNKSVFIRFIKTKIKFSICIIFIIFSIIGFVHVSYKQKKFSSIYKESIFKVTVISDVIKEKYNNKYIVKLDNYNINVYIYVNKKIKLEYGDYIKLETKIDEPEKQRNRYGFDYKEYLKSINIIGNMYVNEYKLIKKNKVNLFDRFIYTIKNNIRKKIYEIVKTDNKYLLEAILIGNKEKISNEIKNNFERSNLSHLLAISGTHIAIIIILLSKLLKCINIGKRKSYYINIILLYLYMYIIGTTPSITRACITIILITISKLIHRKSDIINNIALSMIIILASNPFNITNLSFILSYGGVFGIMLYNVISKRRLLKQHDMGENYIKKEFNIINISNRMFTYIRNMLLVSVCVQIAIFPIIINSFNKISFTFFISNIIASPLLILVIALGIIIIILGYIFFPIGLAIGEVLNIILDILLYVSEMCSKLPLSNVYCIRIDMPLICIYYCILMYIIYLFYIGREHIIKHILKKYYMRFLVGLLIIILITSVYNHIGIKDLRIDFIDVGQGDASLIKTSCNRTILIDGGGKNENSENGIGKRVLLPYLLNNKINSIDYVIISHFDIDHVRTDYLQL